jgi:hypothetical protein
MPVDHFPSTHATWIDAQLTIAERAGFANELKKDLGVPELPERTDLYSLVNALTATAHDAPPARRLELEAIGGDLLAAHTRGAG